MNNNFMRGGQNRNRNRNRNNRHRSGGGGGGGSGNNKVFDSNGPDVKVRGTAQTVAEKYMQLGRDAQSSGDNVSAESYYQHAEHYYRMWAANQPPGASLIMSRRLGEDETEANEDGSEDEVLEVQQPAEVAATAEGAEGVAPVEGQPQQQADGQPRQGRDRFRPRWQRGRDRQNRNQDNAGGEPNGQAPAAVAEMAQDGAQWEAPSFLQRPAPRADEPAPEGE